MIRNFATVIISCEKVPLDWEQRFIVCLYKSKGGAMDKGKTILGRIVDGLIIRWCLLMTPSSALSQEEALQMHSLHEKYHEVNRRFYMTFVDLEKNI